MNADQVDAVGRAAAGKIERQVASEGITPPLTLGKLARITTIAAEVAGPEFTFGTMIDVARSNMIVVTATAFHGKVEA